ncbi:MAG: CHAT domain-containing tetratricopeptide repeat protein [Candidatus Omnitrophica bacterium]|nr:CHAT domain-containing tetratricopeptide repeat protein [Candidatus Omnitrophota bacterium]
MRLQIKRKKRVMVEKFVRLAIHGNVVIALCACMSFTLMTVVAYSADQSADKYQEAKRYFLAGMTAMKNEDYKLAEEAFEAAFRDYSALPGTERAQAGCYGNIAAALGGIGRYEEAIGKEEQALKLLAQLPGTEGEQAICYGIIGIVLEKMGRYEESIGKIEQALKLLAQLPGTERKQADCYGTSGLALHGLGRYEQAIGKYEQALKMYEQLSGTEGEWGKCYANIGVALEKLGRYKQAIGKEEKALKLFSQISGTEREQAGCYQNIGDALNGLGWYEQAIGKYEQALKMYEQLLGTEWVQASCYGNIGLTLKSLGRYEEAIGKYEQALKLLAQLPGTEWVQAGCYGNIGLALDGLGQHERAMEKQEQALKLLAQLPDTERDRASCYVNIGVALKDLGRYEESIGKIEQALKLYRQVSGTEGYQASCFGHIGEDYLAQGQPAKALEAFERSSQYGFSWWIANGMAKAYHQRGELGDKEKSAKQLVKATQLAEKARQGVFAMENRVGVFEEPSEVFRTAVSLLVGWSDQEARITEPEIARWMEGVPSQQGLAAAAAFHFTEAGKGRALEDALRERAALNLGDQGGDLLTEQRELSLRLSKLSKGREELSLEELLRKKPKELQLEKTDIWKSLTSEIDALESRMAQIEGEIKRTRLGEYIAPDFRLPSQMAGELTAHTAVLEYSIGEDGSYLLVLTHKGITAYKLPVAVRALPELHKRQNIELPQLLKAWKQRPLEIGLEGLVYLARARVESKNSDKPVNAAQEQAVLERLGAVILPKKVLQEFRDKDIRHLLVVADGVLHMVPFAILRLKESSGSCYVVERFAVSYVPTMTILETIRRQKAQRRARRQGVRADLLAFANPVYTIENEGLSSGTDDSMARVRTMRWEYYKSEGLKLDNLSKTEEEATRVAKLFAAPETFTSQMTDTPKGRAVVFSGLGADEAQVKRLLGWKQKDFLPGNWKYVLFSMHGWADIRNGMLSCLFLSTAGPDSVEDGVLQAQEVMGLEMDTDVVMLSACETGLGRLGSGEGFLGLSMAFFIAGTESVCASLWQVPVVATVQLVTEFFRNLKDGELDRAEALRQAQLTVMKKGQDSSGEKADYSSPFYWGAFELMGEYAVSPDAEDGLPAQKQTTTLAAGSEREIRKANCLHSAEQ